MNIVFLLSSFRLSGGVALVIAYAEQLVQHGHCVTIVTPGGTVDPQLRATLPPAVQVLESPFALSTPMSWFALARLALSLASITPPADLLIATHTPTTVPVWLAGLRQRRTRRAWLYMDYPEMFRTRPLERWLLRTMPRWFDLILTISDPLTAALRQQTTRPVVMTGSGLPRAELFFQQQRLPSPDGKRRILYVGDDRPRKGLAEFLAATALVAKEITNLQLVIVTKTPCTITTPLAHEFHLRPSDEALAALYGSSEIYVSTSWGEGLGYPPLEAMACGTPVVLTDSGGVRDYARHAENCLVVPVRDVTATAQAIQQLLTEPDLAQRLVNNGRQTAQGYTWTQVGQRLEAMLQTLHQLA